MGLSLNPKPGINSSSSPAESLPLQKAFLYRACDDPYQSAVGTPRKYLPFAREVMQFKFAREVVLPFACEVVPWHSDSGNWKSVFSRDLVRFLFQGFGVCEGTSFDRQIKVRHCTAWG